MLGELEKKGSLSAALRAELSGTQASEKEKDGMEVDASSTSVTALLERLRAAHTRGAVSTAVYFELIALKPPLPDGAEEPQPDMEVIENPARVLRAQEKHISLLPNSRYEPVAQGRRAGIIVLKDTTPEVAEELLQITSSVLPGGNPDEEEPSPPAPFEFHG